MNQAVIRVFCVTIVSAHSNYKSANIYSANIEDRCTELIVLYCAYYCQVNGTWPVQPLNSYDIIKVYGCCEHLLFTNATSRQRTLAGGRVYGSSPESQARQIN